MAGSYRSALNCGGLEDLRTELEFALGHLKTARDLAQDYASDENQFDNAADTGALSGRLSAAIMIVESELPEPK